MNFADHITAADNEPLRVVKPRTRSSQKYTLTEQMKHQMNSVSSRTIAEDDTAVVMVEQQKRRGGGAGGRAAESILRQLSQAPSRRTKAKHATSPSVQAKLDDANALSEAHHYAAAKSVLHGVLDAAADSGEVSALDEKDVVLALAQCLHMEGDDAAWIEMLCHAAALETSDSALELKIADAVFDELQYEAALVHFDAALTQLRAVAPAAAMASMGARRLSKMALCAFQMNDPIRAKGLCRQAIALESENAVAKKLLKKIVARQQRSRLALNAALTPPSQQPLRLNERNGSLSSQQQPAPPGRRREGGAATLASLGSRQRLILQPGQRLSMGGGGGLGGSGTPRGGAEAAQPCKHCSASLAETLTLTKMIRKMEERASMAEKKVSQLEARLGAEEEQGRNAGSKHALALEEARSETSKHAQRHEDALDDAAHELKRVRAAHADELREHAAKHGRRAEAIAAQLREEHNVALRQQEWDHEDALGSAEAIAAQLREEHDIALRQHKSEAAAELGKHASMHDQHAEVSAAVDAELRDEHSAALREHERNAAAAQENHRTALAAVRKEHSAALRKHERYAAAAQENHRAVLQEHERNAAAVRDQHTLAVRKQAREYAKAVEAHVAVHGRRADEQHSVVLQQHEREAAATRDLHEAEMERVLEEHSVMLRQHGRDAKEAGEASAALLHHAASAAKLEEHNNALEQRECEAAAACERHAVEMSSVREEHAAEMRRHAAVTGARVGEAHMQLEGAHGSTAQMQLQVSHLESEIVKLKHVCQQYARDLAEATSAHAVVQQERDEHVAESTIHAGKHARIRAQLEDAHDEIVRTQAQWRRKEIQHEEETSTLRGNAAAAVVRLQSQLKDNGAAETLRANTLRENAEAAVVRLQAQLKERSATVRGLQKHLDASELERTVLERQLLAVRRRDERDPHTSKVQVGHGRRFVAHGDDNVERAANKIQYRAEVPVRRVQAQAQTQPPKSKSTFATTNVKANVNINANAGDGGGVAQMSPEDVATNWVESDHGGRPFWGNKVTKATTWVKPACLKLDRASAAAATVKAAATPAAKTVAITTAATKRGPERVEAQRDPTSIDGAAWSNESDDDGY